MLHLPYNAKKDGEYQVIINGSGLIGANSVAMKANIDNTYQLEYLPLELGE